jgi:hypothetical protein
MKSLFLVICCIANLACNQKRDETEYYELTRQLTPNDKNFIYSYGRFGPMAWSGDVVGTEIMGIDEAFQERSGVKLDGLIGGWLSQDTLLLYKFSSEVVSTSIDGIMMVPPETSVP